jgi:hypothetical protein
MLVAGSSLFVFTFGDNTCNLYFIVVFYLDDSKH